MGKRKKTSGVRVGDPARVRDRFAKAVDAIRSGDVEKGARLLAQADRLAPDTPAILFNLGYVNHLAGRHEQAIGYYRRCLERQPELLDGWVNLAAAARESGRLELAAESLAEVVRRRPDDAAAHNDLGNALAQTGRDERAVDHYLRALGLDASRNDTRRNLAVIFARIGRAQDAERQLREVLERDPDDDRARMTLVATLDEQNRVDEAEAVLFAKPGGLEGVEEHLLAGNLRMRQGKAALAEGNYREILALRPDHGAALNNLGLIRALASDREGAERLFRRCLEADESCTDAWRNLVALRKYRAGDDADILAMRALAARGDLPEAARIHLGFALGKALDDCGCYHDAFGFYRTANELRRRQVVFDAEALGHHAQRIRTVFDGAFLSRHPGRGVASLLPVYIVGMPRTGTTLLEQILSAHPAFHGAGELLLVNRLIARLEMPANGASVQVYPECAGHLGAEAVNALAQDYLRALREVAPGRQVERISDKMPYNFFHLGLVRLLFPEARIIHCRRDPLDACLSAYFNYFPRGLDFTYDFDDLVAFYAIYREMMDHWRQSAGIDYFDVDYEDVVAEPEATIRGVLAYLDLPWCEEVLSFHESRRKVQTLSAWQVRRPLHGQSRARWRHYQPMIQPLIEGLSRVGAGVRPRQAAERTD